MGDDEVREHAGDLGLSLEIKNNREHWIFRSRGFKAEWWPSTGRLVFNGRFKKPRRSYRVGEALDLIRGYLRRSPQAKAFRASMNRPASYLDRVRELADT